MFQSNLLVLVIIDTLVYSVLPRKMLFILIVHSYSFLPFLYNLIHRLTELNVSLFYLIKLVFFKNN